MQPELAPADIHAEPSGFCDLLDALRLREFQATLDEIRRCLRAGSAGQWELVKGTVFQEFSVRCPAGKVASIAFSTTKDGKAISTEAASGLSDQDLTSAMHRCREAVLTARAIACCGMTNQYRAQRACKARMILSMVLEPEFRRRLGLPQIGLEL